MKRLALLSLLIWVLLMVFLPDTAEPSAHSDTPPADRTSDLAGAWQVFKSLVTASRDALYLLAELALEVLKKGWDGTHSRLRVIYGMFFTGVGSLAFVGLWFLLTLNRLSN